MTFAPLGAIGSKTMSTTTSLRSKTEAPGINTGAPADEPDSRQVEGFPAFEQMHLLTYMQLADAKASVFLAITSGAIAYLVGHYGLGWLRLEDIGRHLVLLSLSTTTLAISASYSVAVIVPRVGTSPESIIHFRAIIRRPSAREYVDELLAKSQSEIFYEQAAYCHELARTCAKKYQLLDRSFFAGIIGYAAFLATLVLL
jgi:hypothetical protein